MTHTLAGKKEKPSKTRVLEECLILWEAMKRQKSRHLNGLTPEPGYEKEFEMDQMRCDALREMIQELKSAGTQAAEVGTRGIAKWQEELMTGAAVDMSDLDPAAGEGESA